MCKDRICALIVLYAPFHFNLIHNMITFRKNVLTFDPTKGVEGCVTCLFVWCLTTHH